MTVGYVLFMSDIFGKINISQLHKVIRIILQTSCLLQIIFFYISLIKW